MSTPVATLLPFTSLKNFKAALDFLQWLKKTRQSGWLTLPISAPLMTPYRGDGIGIASDFYDNQVPEDYQVWVIERQDFIANNQDWLPNFALHKALSEHFHTNQWWTWPTEIANYQESAVIDWRMKLQTRIEVFIDEQYFLANQFIQLKRLAAEKEILMIGDLPFYIAQESALVWANQDLFMLGSNGELRMESGVPVHEHEPFGQQFWGHPLYDWQGADDVKIIDLFAVRLKFLAQFYDLVRIDHANGFFRYGMMSRKHPSWSKKVDGPGSRALKKLLQKTQQLNLGIFFEDIASDRMRLEHFMKEYEVAGMSVLTLLYNLENLDDHKMKVTDEELQLTNLGGNRVVFSSTHDTPPLITWVKSMPPAVRKKILAVNDFDHDLTDKGFAAKLREELLKVPAKLIVVPWQDWHLDNFRFNVPGREEHTNWNYLVPIEKY